MTRVAVVGATGAVGREIVRILDERDFPLEELVLFASARSEGKRLEFRGSDISVRPLEDGWHRGIDLALTSAGTPLSREIVPPAANDGTLIVDNSSAFRMDPNAPLVVPEINADALSQHSGIVANPNCTAITAVMPLGPLHRRFGLRSLVTSSYQSVSGAGMKGVRELAEQIEKLHGQEEGLGYPEPESLPIGDVFPRTIAFNVIPHAEQFDPEGSGFTTEELKMGAECRKILGITDLPVAATAVRVPVAVGHAVSVYATFENAVTPQEAREVLEAADGLLVMDDPEAGVYPTPLDSAGRDEVLVGRIRQPKDDPNALMFFSAGDNLRKGAALNAVQIAELLVEGVPRNQRS
ncbi:MAG TPA: aspartate-semialdehyde dehydrogenase [Actinomycetota bacterium]|nr:aspartate-semialdehyde dehydrogenase [Actinomycetota bacterium]